MIFADMKLAWL